MKKTRIKPVSGKRKKLNEKYKIVCEEIKSNPKNHRCFFCDWGVDPRFVDVHHKMGRDGDLMVDKNNLVLAHRGCHLHYHQLKVKYLLECKWYREFLNRIRISDPEVYQKELRRLEKGGYNEEYLRNLV